MGATRAVFYLGQEAFLGSIEGFLLAAMVVWLVSEVACLKVGRGKLPLLLGHVDRERGHDRPAEQAGPKDQGCPVASPEQWHHGIRCGESHSSRACRSSLWPCFA